MLRPQSIRSRLGLGVGLITLLAVLATVAVQLSGMRAYLLDAEHARLIGLLPRLEGELSRPLAARAPIRAIENLPRSVDIRIVQGERVVASTPGFPPLPLTLPLGFRKQAGHDVLVATVQYRGQVARAQLASEVLGIVDPLRVYLRSLAWTVPLTVGLAGVLGFLLAGRLLTPLRRLGQAAEHVAAGGDWRAPLPLTGARDEVGSMARILQAGFTQVAEVREREVLFTRAAAHDLRSPLTALKTRLQSALSGPRQEADLREDIREALTDVERMRSLSDHLLLLAQGLRDVELRPLDLSLLAGEVVDLKRETWPDIPIEFESGGPALVQGDPMLLRQLLRNLIQNALRHGGAPVIVRVDAQPEGVTLTVSDQGAEVRRAPNAAGVGLQLVRRIAAAHQAELEIAERPEGRADGGWRVTVTFPTLS